MKKIKLELTLLLGILFLLSNFVIAQEEIFYIGNRLGVGARAMGMGGAHIAVAEDYTANYWNPAGLGQIRRMELQASFSHTQATNQATFFGNTSQDDISNTELNSLGFVFPIPTYRGSLVFSLGFNRVRDFNYSLKFSGFNPHYAAYYDLTEFYTTVDDSVNQSETILESGGLKHWTLSGAVEVEKNFFVGASLNLWSGKDEFSRRFKEEDLLDIHNTYWEKITDQGDTLAYWDDFKKLEARDNITSDFEAINLKIGALYRLNNFFRVGATITTPTVYTIEENGTFYEEESFDGVSDIYYYDPDPTYTKYKIQEPYVFGLGAALSVANLLLAGDIEFQDWTQAKFMTDPPIKDVSKDEVNLRIKDNFRSG
ncbi:MAG: hypothetical protein ONB05_05925 [candidate division KSB1 bacterium]|nr:hypothetical protein [candidate division KSB1 bacterium]